MTNELLKEAETAANKAIPMYPVHIEELERLKWAEYITHLRQEWAKGYVAGVAKERERGGWLPIETAPRDGTVIMRWVRRHKFPQALKYIDWIGLWQACNVAGVSYEESELFPHWQPLSSPPETSNS